MVNMLKPKNKKNWSDYPLYSFRTDKKKEIDALARSALKLTNRSIDTKKYKKVKKGELLAEALILGLKEIERRKS